MKTLKNTLAILLIAFITMNVNAQVPISKKVLEEFAKNGDEDGSEEALANKGDAEAQFNLGYMYVNGFVKDYDKAFYWFMKSAKQGNANAEFNVGNCFENGNGTEIDLAKAFKWYKKSATQGLDQAQYRVGNMYLQGNGVDEDKNQASIWLQKSVAQGSQDAQTTLGVMYYFGDGITKNEEKGVGLIKKAANNGHERAKDILEKLKLDDGPETGCISGDCENGWGTYIWEDGNKYEGNWKNGKKNGEGNLYWIDNNKYFGDFVNDQLEGSGSFILSNGEIYKGEFKNGQFNGKGKYYDKEGSLFQTGTWIDGKYQVSETGCLSGDCKNGKGTFLWENGQKYIGQWKDGKLNGYGIYYLENGEVFHDGQWKNHEKVE